MAKTFVISDQNVNRYGFRILTAGIQLANFLQNPIMLYMHKRGGEMLPIGRWENLRFEGTRLLGDAVFDQNDPFAKQIESKVDQGIINCVSPGLAMLDYSFDDVQMLPGQTGPTVTVSELQEVSFVDVPGNANAIRLSSKVATITLGYDEDLAEALNQFFPENPNTRMKRIYLALGLPQESTSEDAAMKAIEKLQQEKKDAEVQLAAKADETVTLAAAKLSLEKQLADIEAAAKQKAAEDMVTLAFDKGKISAKEKDGLLKLALQSQDSFELVKGIIEDRKVYTPITAQLSAANSAAPKAAGEMTFSQLRKSNPKHLAELKAKNPTEWQRLYDEEFKK